MYPYRYVFKGFLLSKVWKVFNSWEHSAQQGTSKTAEAVCFGDENFTLSSIIWLVPEGRR